jgi:DtxR family transcriptional regulator, Mn-dependent transcriptional regulator
MISAQTEEYLETIRRLEERGEPATTSALAQDLGVSSPSVTEMVLRLVELGFVTRRPRGEVLLTDAGRAVGTTVVRRHRLWERFLTDVLGLPWENVHAEACRLEHATSPDTEARLAEAVGDSQTCPHGNAIPGPDGSISNVASEPLSSSAIGDRLTVASVEETASALQAASHLGIRPGARVVVLARGPSGDLSVEVARRRIAVPVELLPSIRVVSCQDSSEQPDALSLADLPSSSAGAVRGIGKGSSLAARCLALGFTPGTRIDMVQNIGRGPVIVSVRDTRVALGRGEARAITVSPLD